MCIAHVTRYASNRANSILEQVEEGYEEKDEKRRKLKEDLRALKELLKELPEEGGGRIGRLHREYLGAARPTRKGAEQTKQATAAYRMRMLTLQVADLEQVGKAEGAHQGAEVGARWHQGLNGTNNASERASVRA